MSSHDKNNKSNKSSAGSGNFAFSSRREAREDNISNPRVLSDMGLAIPRPTRLGDPRSSSNGLVEVLISLLISA
jgi:hypothetical protein